MTDYRSTARFERREVGPEGDAEWGIPEDSLRAPDTVAFRTLDDIPRVVFIGSPEQAAVEYEPVEA